VTRQVLPESASAGLAPCQSRVVDTELLAVVTQQFSLPETYTPPDLVPLSDFFEDSITLGQDLYARQAIIEPLQTIVGAMHEAGLRPSIISAYRSYSEQALAWKWWSSQYPGRVAILSARPGYSEHQLGTTVDFGSPSIDHLFHIDFANTAEGVWLTNNAHLFGFTLSYPDDTYSITGIKYEPWHFRYVGTNLATQLFNSGQLLTRWQLENLPPPCLP
jgi:D-alanyl-D-alanine carboxypeptidase